MKTVLVRTTPYRCTHKIAGVPYWTHRAYNLELVNYGLTMAPTKRQVRSWALDWLRCNDEEEEWEVIIEWN